MLSVNNSSVLVKTSSGSIDKMMDIIDETCAAQHKLTPKICSGLNNSCSQMLLSCRSMKVMSQENEIKNLKKHIEVLNNENKTIRTQNFRIQKEIDSIQTDELNMSNIFKQHEADIYNLKEKVRKTRAALSREQKLRTDKEMESFELRAALYKKQEIITENQLLEKFDIKKILNSTQETLESKQLELEAAKRQLESQDKNYKIELTNIQKVAKLSNDRIEELESHVAFLKISLKEKQRLLDIQNIYSNRFNLGKLPMSGDDNLKCYKCLSKFDQELCKDKMSISHNSLVELPRMECSEYKNKENSEGIYKKKFRRSESDKERSKMIADIRKIIIDEIHFGKFAVQTNHISNESEIRTTSPIKILATDCHIKSPLIKVEKTDVDKTLTGKVKISVTSDCIKRPRSMLQNQLQGDKAAKKKTLSSSNGEPCQESGLKLKCDTKIDKPQTNSTITDIKSDILYQHPNKNAVVENENWLKEIETISVLDAVCDVKNKCFKKETIVKVMNNADSRINPLQTMNKLSQPILDDLKDKTTVIDENVKIHLLNNVLGNSDSKGHRMTAANNNNNNDNENDNNSKNSLQNYIFSKQTQNVEKKWSQVGL